MQAALLCAAWLVPAHGITIDKSRSKSQTGLAELAHRFLGADRAGQDRMLQDPAVLQAIWRQMNSVGMGEPMEAVIVESEEPPVSGVAPEVVDLDPRLQRPEAEAPIPPEEATVRDLARAMAMRVLKATQEKIAAERQAKAAAHHLNAEQAKAAEEAAAAKVKELKEMAHKMAYDVGKAAKAAEAKQGQAGQSLAPIATEAVNSQAPAVEAASPTSAESSSATTCSQRVIELERQLAEAEDRLRAVRDAIGEDVKMSGATTTAASQAADHMPTPQSDVPPQASSTPQAVVTLAPTVPPVATSEMPMRTVTTASPHATRTPQQPQSPEVQSGPQDVQPPLSNDVQPAINSGLPQPAEIDPEFPPDESSLDAEEQDLNAEDQQLTTVKLQEVPEAAQSGRLTDAMALFNAANATSSRLEAEAEGDEKFLADLAKE